MQLKNYQINTLNVLRKFFEEARICGHKQAFENITSNHTLSVTFKIISATLTVVNNTGIQNIVSYPTEKQLAYNESVNVIVTTPHNSNFKATENRNNIEFNKLSNFPFSPFVVEIEKYTFL